jgi:sugar phosphate isomerase/epimerase
MSHPQNNSRREFLTHSAILSLGMMLPKDMLAFGPKPNSKFGGVQMGVITYSFRSMPGSIDQLIDYCKTCGISAIELMGEPAEAFAGSPVPFGGGPNRDNNAPKLSMQERNKLAKEWRETVGMEKFVELRKKFNKEGISIYAYKPNALNENNSDGEIEYALKAAKALGATSVTVEIPNKPAQSKRLGDLASKHKVYIGYHAHTQATDTAWDEALAQSPYNSLNLDCGHYIAAGGNNTKESLLALIVAKNERITSMHLKDRKNKTNGGENMPWGEGDTPIKEILSLLKTKKYKIPVSVELEYNIPAESDAVKEVGKCLAYAKNMLS